MAFETWTKPPDSPATMWEVVYDRPGLGLKSTLVTPDRVEGVVRQLAKDLGAHGGAVLSVEPVDNSRV